MDMVFLGDSLIEYFDWQARFRDHSVMNLGVAGESVEGLLGRVVKIKDILSHADRIFIMSGINNVAMGDLEFIDFYGVILEKLSLFYPRAKISIHSLLPALASFIPEASIGKINESLRKLSRDHSVEYLDLHGKFIDSHGNVIREYFVEDGVHLSTTGYELWSQIIEGLIIS